MTKKRNVTSGKLPPKWVCVKCKEVVSAVGKGGVMASMREHRNVCWSSSGSTAGFQIKR